MSKWTATRWLESHLLVGGQVLAQGQLLARSAADALVHRGRQAPAGQPLRVVEGVDVVLHRMLPLRTRMPAVPVATPVGTARAASAADLCLVPSAGGAADRGSDELAQAVGG